MKYIKNVALQDWKPRAIEERNFSDFKCRLARRQTHGKRIDSHLFCTDVVSYHAYLTRMSWQKMILLVEATEKGDTTLAGQITGDFGKLEV